MAEPARRAGRFAPSPTGPLHGGSLVAALASWLDARARQGRWLVRMEDVDTRRCRPAHEATILAQLGACGLAAPEPPWRQSERGGAYAAALQHLVAAGLAYPCRCSRRDIEAANAKLGRPRARHGELVYPGTCRPERPGAVLPGDTSRMAWRLRVSPGRIDWHDRRLGAQSQDVEAEVGDFVLRRADGVWAYQLAVVVDDAAQGITDVVRGEDLADNTPRQIVLQRALGLPTPTYLHTPLVLGPDGEKLSKQNGARPLDTSRPVEALRAAGRVLGLQADASTPAQWLALAAAQWHARWVA
jgi:glutamyl-Q tRNA(Asp) synthetase